METLSFQKPKYNFQHMRYCGTSTVCKNSIPSSPVDEMDPVFRQIVKDHPEFGELHKIANHRSAQCNPETYGISLNKCDVPCKKPNNQFFDLAKQYTEQMYAFVSGCGATDRVDYGPKTAVGTPFDRMINPQTGQPFKNKGEFLNSTVCTEEMSQYYDEIFKVLNKVEFLPKEDIDNKKSRTYFCGNTPLVIRQKLMYDNMDEKMCDNVENFFKCWSRYGFTRQYGGFDRLARAHRKIEERAKKLGIDPKYIRYKTADVSGWDRAMSVMKEIYELRQKLFGPMTEKQREIHEYIARNLVEPFCVTYLGEIYQRFTGNCSGSGKTTSDNTIGHTMIEMYCWIKMFYDKHNRMPTYDEIIDAVIESLYGDDDLGSFIITEWVDGPDDELDEIFKAKYISLYQDFGLTIKPSAFKVQDTLEGLEFLGGSLKYSDKHQAYLAVPRISKVATTLTYLLEGERDLVQYSSIVQAAYMLTWDVDTEECKLIQHYLRYLSRFILSNDVNHLLSTTDVGFLSSVVLGCKVGDYLVLGRESHINKNVSTYNETFFHDKSLKSDFFFEFQSKRERVGFKSEMNSQKFDLNKNYKGMLNELCMRSGVGLPTFVNEITGPSHTPTITCRCTYGGRKWEAQGSTRADAEKKMCYVLITFLINQASKPEEVKRAETMVKKTIVPHVVVETKRAPQFPPGAHDEVENWDIYDYGDVEEIESKFSNLHFIDDSKSKRQQKQDAKQKREEKFFADMCMHMESYYAIPYEYRSQHYLHQLISDPQCAARIAQMRKMGSFNPYGNGQTTQFVLSKPSIRLVGGLYTCFSTCLLPGPIQIQGEGSTKEEAFNSWLEDVVTHINSWSPPLNLLPELTFKTLRANMPKEVPHELMFIWKQPEEEAMRNFFIKFKEGSFNPYGNGQPAPLSKAQWMKINEKRLAGMNKSVIDDIYSKYVSKHKKRNQPQKSKPAIKVNKASKETKVMKTGIDQRTTVKLSGCAINYVTALAYPFEWLQDDGSHRVKGFNKNELPCIPKFPAVKTRKAKYWIRGVFGCHDPGDSAFVALSPWRLANDGSGVADYADAVLHSTIAVSMSTPAFPTMDTGSLSWPFGGSSFNTPYTTAMLVNATGNVGIKYRIVGAGLRIKYVGNVLQMGGQIHAFVGPDHSTVSDLSVAEISQYDSYVSYTVVSQMENKKDPWTYITYQPVVEEDFDMSVDPASNTGAGEWSNQPTKNHFMGFIITGLPNGIDCMQYEAILLTEEVGANVTSKTNTPSDPIGASAALNSVKPENLKTINDGKSITNLLSTGIQEISATSVSSVNVPVVNEIMDIGAKLLPLVLK